MLNNIYFNSNTELINFFNNNLNKYKNWKQLSRMSKIQTKKKANESFIAINRAKKRFIEIW